MELPIDVTAGNQKRKQLLQQLARQAGISQRPAARPVFGAGRPFFSPGNLPAAPIPQLTRPFPLPPGLQRLLGPGAIGTPGAGEFSPGPGVPAQLPTPPGPPPVGAPNGGASAPGANRQLYGGGEVPIDAPGGPVDGMGVPQSIPGLAQAEPPRGPTGGNKIGPIAMQDDPTGALSSPSLYGGDSGLVPLGNGQYLDAATGEVHGLGLPTLGTSVRGLFMA